MTREGIHIIHDLHFAVACGSPANAAVERYGKTAVATLVGADLEKAGGGHAVKSGPVEAVVRMVDFTGHRGHQRHHVGLAVGNGLDTLVEVLVIHARKPNLRRFCSQLAMVQRMVRLVA